MRLSTFVGLLAKVNEPSEDCAPSDHTMKQTRLLAQCE